jgi:AcrR family transcriptional regulator
VTADSGPPIRRRTNEIEALVLDAAAELLREAGVAGCTIEAVSQRSGIGKPAIYRRWPHRSALAVDAFARRLAVEVPIDDTGDAREDLTRAFAAVAEQYCGPDGLVFRELLAAAVAQPDAARLMREHFFSYRRERLLAIWRAGVARGQLDDDLDPEDGLDLIFGAGIFRLLIGHQPIGADDARRLAHAVLDPHAPRDQRGAANVRPRRRSPSR